LARIQLTFCWDGLGLGQKCHPKDWDAKRELLKAKTGAAGTYVVTVNWMLETYADAAHAAYHDAQLSGQRLPPRHLDYAHHVVRLKAGKTQLPCVVPFLDNDVFRPVALIEKYCPLGLATCLPVGTGLDDYLPTVARLAGLTRIALTSKVGRKTFVTLKLAQGVPPTTVMPAAGHRTKSSFNRYVGIDEAELVANYRKTARQVAKKGGSDASTSPQQEAA